MLALASIGSTQAQVWSAEKTQIADFYASLGVTPMGGKAALTPSLAVGVSIGGVPVLAKGYGHVSPGGPLATGDTIYHIGSVSKQLMAAGILALVEDASGPVTASGKSPSGAPIALDDPITKFVPDSGMYSTGQVTLRNMLNMQSGYVSYTEAHANVSNPFDPTKPVKTRELLRYVLSMLFSNKSPGGGKGFSYSNTNYFLLANVIEFFKAPNGDYSYNYQTWLRSRIFAKAGMSNTGFIGDSFPGALVAPPPYDLSHSSYAQPAWPKGAGEIASSVNDLMKWHAALMNASLTSVQARNLLFTPAPNSTYAMGWDTAFGGGFGWFSHGGDIPGYVSFSGIFVNFSTGKWVSVALLANNDNVPLAAYGACLAQLAMDPSTTKAGLGPAAKAACGLWSW
jgi:CubicO group peptidase (beta-lactamase class C family)